MRVLCFYPGLNPEVNDIAHVLAYLAGAGNEVVVITARHNPSKSVATSGDYEEFDGVKIHRPYDSFSEMMWFPQRKLRACRDIARAFAPEVMLCSQEYNMRLALLVRQKHDMPIVLVSEFAGDLADGKTQGIRAQILLPFLGVPARGRRFWSWLCTHSAALITAYPGDAGRLEELSSSGPPVYYVPWCNELPDFAPAAQREPSRAAYIGTFSRFKNTQEFSTTIPLLFDQTPIAEFVMVGGGDVEVISQLKQRFGQRIQHLKGLSRSSALSLLSSCFFGYTPVARGGWGLIGDCWGSGTPLVATHNDYELNPGNDAIVVSGHAEIGRAVKALYEDDNLYRLLQTNGLQRHERHTAKAVGMQYGAVLDKAVRNQESEIRNQPSAKKLISDF